MKASILLPTIYPVMARAALPHLENNGLPNFEIIVCSPESFEWPGVVWAPDDRKGCGPAFRRAALLATGDIICCISDDVIPVPGWLATALKYLRGGPDDIIGLGTNCPMECFGLPYVCFPVATHECVSKHWHYFMPYTAHWNDVAFGVDCSRCGGHVQETPMQLLNGADRLGCGESALKESAFAEDHLRFLADFKDLAVGYDLPNWRSYNKPTGKPVCEPGITGMY